MIEGKISKLDLTERTAVIIAKDGHEVTVKFPENTSIEISEPETMGTMGGKLEDIKEGYHVQVEVNEHPTEETCICTSLVCIS